MSFEIARAGWVQRESTVLKRWKRCWLVLYQNGEIRLFEKPDNPVAEHMESIGSNCLSILTGQQINSSKPPDGFYASCLFEIRFRTKKWIFCANTADDASAWQMALEQARVTSVPSAQVPAAQLPPAYTQTVGCTGYPIQNTTTYLSAAPGSIIHSTGGTVIHSGPAPGTIIHNGTTTGTVLHTAPGQTVYYNNQPGYMVAPGQQQVVYVDGRRGYRQGYRRRYDGTDLAVGAVAGVALGSLLWGPIIWM